MKTKTKFRFQDLPKDYAALCRVFLPRPIHDGVDYANVAEVADAMVQITFGRWMRFTREPDGLISGLPTARSSRNTTRRT